MKNEPLWKREMKEVFAISLTFFVLFILLMVLKIAFLAQYNIQLYFVGTVLVGSLILGKVVLIFDKMPLTKKMDVFPNIYRVFFRSFIYLAGYILFTVLEHGVKGLIDGDSFGHAWQHAFRHLGSKGFLLSLAIVFIVFLFFNAFWVIRYHLGPKELYNVFFKKK